MQQLDAETVGATLEEIKGWWNPRLSPAEPSLGEQAYARMRRSLQQNPLLRYLTYELLEGRPPTVFPKASSATPEVQPLAAPSSLYGTQQLELAREQMARMRTDGTPHLHSVHVMACADRLWDLLPPLPTDRKAGVAAPAATPLPSPHAELLRFEAALYVQLVLLHWELRRDSHELSRLLGESAMLGWWDAVRGNANPTGLESLPAEVLARIVVHGAEGDSVHLMGVLKKTSRPLNQLVQFEHVLATEGSDAGEVRALLGTARLYSRPEGWQQYLLTWQRRRHLLNQEQARRDDVKAALLKLATSDETFLLLRKVAEEIAEELEVVIPRVVAAFPASRQQRSAAYLAILENLQAYEKWLTATQLYARKVVQAGQRGQYQLEYPAFWSAGGARSAVLTNLRRLREEGLETPDNPTLPLLAVNQKSLIPFSIFF